MPNPYPTPPPSEVAQGPGGRQAFLLGRDSLQKLIRALPGPWSAKARPWSMLCPPEPRSIPPGLTIFSSRSPVPSGPPRKVEVGPLNSTAVHVSWKLPVPSKQHGQIRGYQVTYVRLENGEPRGPPIIQDVMLAEAQVRCWEVAGWEGGQGQHAFLRLWSPGLPLPCLPSEDSDAEMSCCVSGSDGAQTGKLGLGSRNTPSSVLGLPELCQPHLPW